MKQQHQYQKGKLPNSNDNNYNNDTDNTDNIDKGSEPVRRCTGNDGPGIGKGMRKGSNKAAQGTHNVATSSVPNSNDNNDTNNTDNTNNIDKGNEQMARRTGNEHGNEPCPRSPSPLMIDK